MGHIRNLFEIYRARLHASRGGEDLEKLQLRAKPLLTDTIPLENPHHVVLGATLATAFNAVSAIRARNEYEGPSFIAIGGKSVGNLPKAHKKFLLESLEKTELPMPESMEMTEAAYAKQVLIYQDVPEDMIITYEHDTSQHTQANIAILKELNLDKFENRLQFHTLAGNGYRVLGTALKNMENNPVISVKNAFPRGVNSENWHTAWTTLDYVALEMAKALPHPRTGQEAEYVRKGYMVEPDIIRINSRIESANAAPAIL